MALAVPFTLAGRFTCPEHGEELVFQQSLSKWVCPDGHMCHAVLVSDVMAEVDRILAEGASRATS